MSPLQNSQQQGRGPSWATSLGVWAMVFISVWLLVGSGTGSALYDPDAKPRGVTPRGDLSALEQTTIAVFHEASPSVVNITCSTLERGIFGFGGFEVPKGTGTGFIYSSAGHVVTNLHVILDATQCTVRLADESEWGATLVGKEEDKDIAVLKIDAPPERLKPISLGTSSDLQVGQRVLAIGNPFGFDQTLTVGVVSALGREIESISGRKIRDVVQTDAAINHGNSGGPLLDSAGRLIGITTQIASPSGASAGIGFAVPVDIVNDVVPDIIQFGHFRRVGLGVALLDDRLTRRWGLRGCIIETVQPGGGAEEAGLRGTVVDTRGRVRRLGDIVVGVDDHEVWTLNALKDVLEQHKQGDVVEVAFVRDEQLRTAKLTLQQIK